jgi:hypothetical protein
LEKFTGSVRNHQYGSFGFLEVDQRTWWAGDFKIFKVALLLRNWKNLQVPYVISTVATAFWKSIRERGGLVTLKFSKSPFSFAIGKIDRFRTQSVR